MVQKCVIQAPRSALIWNPAKSDFLLVNLDMVLFWLAGVWFGDVKTNHLKPCVKPLNRRANCHRQPHKISCGNSVGEVCCLSGHRLEMAFKCCKKCKPKHGFVHKSLRWLLIDVHIGGERTWRASSRCLIAVRRGLWSWQVAGCLLTHFP